MRLATCLSGGCFDFSEGALLFYPFKKLPIVICALFDKCMVTTFFFGNDLSSGLCSYSHLFVYIWRKIEKYFFSLLGVWLTFARLFLKWDFSHLQIFDETQYSGKCLTPNLSILLTKYRARNINK